MNEFGHECCKKIAAGIISRIATALAFFLVGSGGELMLPSELLRNVVRGGAAFPLYLQGERQQWQ